MQKLQFRVLYREFLFRMVDIELLSAHALGDSNKLLGQFAALLIFVSMLMAIPSLGAGDIRTPPALRLFVAWSAEHFLIATTMLVVGLFAVLSWDSTFLERRDVYVLAPLPVRGRTLFLAKVAAVATALSLTVALFHSLAGLGWPLALGAQGTLEMSTPVLGLLPAAPPADTDSLGPLLDRDLAPMIPREMGVAIGVVKGGRRRVFVYGTARRDSMYQIASVTKTFTGLLLAQMAVEGKVRLDEPLRELLPPGTVPKPTGREITLLDLATHHSGLPPMPDNLASNFPNPDASYTTADLYAFIDRHGVARPENPSFAYSNVGFALLGQALAERAGVSYPELIARRITGPLGMRGTAINLSPAETRRVIPGYSVLHEPRPVWELGALGPAGGIWSTAGDMLTYLEAQLQAATPAVRLSHRLQARLIPGVQITLAWVYDEAEGIYWHNGAVSGYTSYALFNPSQGYGAVVLVNQAPSLLSFCGLAAWHIRQRLTGRPAVSLASVIVPQSGGISGVLRMFAAYWTTMLLAGTFIFCCVLVLQGLASQLLPRRLYLRISSLLQLGAYCAIVCVYLLQPMIAAGSSLMDASGRGLLAWSPSFWFLGLYQQLNGSPALGLLARRAWTGLAVILCATALVYTLSYLRTLRKIVEEPDIVAGARGGVWLPRFGTAHQTAIIQFSIRTLLRSRQHRLILAFYLGMGLAFMIFVVQRPAALAELDEVAAAELGDQPNAPLLAASIALMCFSVIGTRVVFSLPMDLRANWIFRATAARRVAGYLKASRRALLLLSAAPIWTAFAVLCFWRWPWRAAASHLAILAMISLVLAELCLYGFDKIPFTCSYLPGKSQVHMVVLGAVALLWAIAFGVRYERLALEDPARCGLVLGALGAVWAAARWRTAVHARSDESEVQFEESEDPAVMGLGLSGSA